MHAIRIRLAAVTLLALASAAGAAATPWRLVVSANYRFLQRADGSPFFWLADTGWLLLTKLDRAGARRCLDDRQAKGFNVIQVMVLHTADARAAPIGLVANTGVSRLVPPGQPTEGNDWVLVLDDAA